MPVGQLLGQQPRRPSKWRAISRWRDWRLSVKLAAVTLIPILIALVLGGITISNQVQRSGDYERINRLVVLSTDVRALVDALQQERTRTAALLTQGTVGSSPELDAARAATDRALKPLSADTGRVTEVDTAVAAPGTASNNALARIGEVRQQIAAGQLDSVQALDAYSAMTTALLALDTSLVAGMGDPSISGTANALHDLQVAKEEVATSQVLLNYGIARGSLTPTQLNQLRTAEVRLADRLEDFRAAASGAQGQDFDRTVTGQNFDTRSRLVSGVLATQGLTAGDALKAISGDQWNTVATAVVDSLRAVSARLGDTALTTSGELLDTAGTDAGLLAVLLFAALVLTAAIVFLITRQLLSSLRKLRTSALDIADRQLPAAVANIQEGREQSAEVVPVSIGTADEIGQVGKAFDAVHSQALRLAMEQATMRTGYSSVFVNLSRRSQSLVQRQLQLIERLERDEEDADQLATLFQLDHLATRMRRNNENLMVLSGAEPGRRTGQPVTTADVLRAAVSEIEQYQRVTVQTPPTARVVGYAASDLMRLIAELLDNATAFSAPETQVTVSTRVGDNRGLIIDIMDKGIGMNEAEVAEANVRLTEAATVDLATSRRMGLFVVGRLAGRHHIGVTLHGGKDIAGVRATVTVPPEMVMGLPEPVAPEPVHQPDPELPRRRTVNGAGRPGALTSLAGTTSGTLGDGAAAPGAWTQNGHSGMLPPRPASDVEVSGTALFSPIQPDELDRPPADPQPEELPGGELPSGAALFEANTSSGALTEWWSAAAAEPAPPPPPPTPRETTPIFDETLSAWFRSDEPAPKPAKAEGAEKPAEEKQAEPAQEEAEAKATTGWDFAADESFRAARAASQAEPTSYTQAGLPRRRRGEHLMPGSATPGAGAQPAASAAESAPQLPSRDPADIRGRLSSFQHGLSRARHAAKPADASGVDQSSSAEASSADAGTAASATTAAGLPQRQRRSRPQTQPGQEVWPGGPESTAATPTSQPWQQPAGEPGEQPPAASQSLGENPLPQRNSGVDHAASDENSLPRRNSGAEQATAGQSSSENPLPRRRSGAERAAAGESSGENPLPRREPAVERGAASQSPGEDLLPRRQPGAEHAAAQASGENPLPRRRPSGEPAAAGQEPSGENSLPRRQSAAERAAAGQPSGESPWRQPFAAPAASGQPSGDNPLPRRQTGPERAARAEGNPLPQRRPGTRPRRLEPPEEQAEEPSTGYLWQKPQLFEDQQAPVSETPLPRRQDGGSEPAGAGGESAWSFATDESWQTVQAASQAAPSSYTAAGLPRRRRGEQLMPGSASSAGAVGPRAQRDPQDVRGRLNSFQQGVRRGRHRTGQPVESEHETMEGE
ncbi:nitrate- and nitrite sensing domain-containing protein [Amycolatopsis pithecellobii]|uniref:histidine kinase n=1 Tax=Amycolatopsis pithecellobii TaxID=664692 RepID=A0A6N7ZB23_9PSEU|nr:nitrate- and nitrite sensing domain-containing protein [Amycolatopsis pithecellobii]MTD58961.1 HAMP domain-containing protein [Amycolatopsis pithecellobii]